MGEGWSGAGSSEGNGPRRVGGDLRNPAPARGRGAARTSGTEAAAGAAGGQAGPTAEPRSAAAEQPKVPPLPEELRSGEPRRHHWKLFATVGVGCLTINLLVVALSIALVSLGLASCVASCSDNPLGDSREDAAFIASLEASERDLTTFDALSGCIEALCNRRQGWETEGRKISASDLRASIVAGSWPEDSTEALNPRVWVRIAELSQTWLEGQTDGRWEVLDFSYPFPDNGPIPVPATRDEGACCLTRLHCTEGADAGLVVQVGYYRWAREAHFEADLDEARTERAAREELLAQVEATDLGGRQLLLDGNDLYVWELGRDDVLRDPEAFLPVANEVGALLGNYGYVNLMVADTPTMLGYNTLSYDYPNNRPVEQVSYTEARQRLLDAGTAYEFDHAGGDILLSCCRKQDEDAVADDLTGALAPTPRTEWSHPWHAPKEGSTFDGELLGVAAGALGTAEDQLVVTSLFEVDNIYDAETLWVIMPRGVMAETPKAFCTQLEGLSQAFWDEMWHDPERRNQLYVHLYVIDEASITDAQGEQATFAQLREVAQADPTALDGYHFDLLLSAMPFYSRWEGEDELNVYGLEERDVGGSIARSRSWRYSEE